MENEPNLPSTLAWFWVIEALASFKELNLSLLHDIIEMAPELPDGSGKNTMEMLALRCLEGLFTFKKDFPLGFSKVTFDSSESCEDVLERILCETSEDGLIHREGGSEMLKWDVSPFIAQKRACMHSSLQQLKDKILDGTHPYVDFLIEKSGLTCVNKRDNIPVRNIDCIVLNRSLSSSSSDPQSKKETSSFRLLPSKRKRIDSSKDEARQVPCKRRRIDSSEDEARQVPDCDDVSMNVKKLKQHFTCALSSGEEAASPHGTGLLEDSSDTVLPQNERDDTNHLGEFQMGVLEEDEPVKEHSGSKRSGPCIDELHLGQLGIPCDTMMAPANEGETHKAFGIEKVKDKSVPFEPNLSNNSLNERTLHKTSTNASMCDVGNDFHVKATKTVSHNGFLPKTVGVDTDDNRNPYEEEKDTLSDSDGYLNEKIDIAMKKNEFISSQGLVSHDSFVSVDGSELTLCMKCNKGGQLLSCNISDCPLVVHEKCLGSSVRMNDRDYFCCPFCLCQLANSEYLEAKKEADLTKKNLSTFIRIGLEHQPIVIGEGLRRKDLGHSQKAGVQDVVEICDDVDLGNKDNQVNPDVEHRNEVVDPKICQDVNLENEENQVNLDGEHVKEFIDNQCPKIIETEQITQLSESFDIINSKHRENEANALRVDPDVLAGEKGMDELADQEYQANTVAELEDSVNATAHKNDIPNISVRSLNILHADKGPMEAAIEQEVLLLHHQTGDSEGEPVFALNTEGVESSDDDIDESSDDDNDESSDKKPVYALNIEGAESSDDDNDESIISNYSIRFRRQKYHHTCPASPQLRRKKLLWTAEEEETLKEGVQKFSSSVQSSPTIPWKKILDFGSSVFFKGRTPVDLKDKWRNLCKSPKTK